MNLLVGDSCSLKLRDHISTAGLSVVNTRMPTRYANNTNPSLLDYFITSDLTYVLKFDQLCFISDHDLIFCTFDIAFHRPAADAAFMYRDLRSIDFNVLFADCSRIPWTDCWYYETVDKNLIF